MHYTIGWFFTCISISSSHCQQNVNGLKGPAGLPPGYKNSISLEEIPYIVDKDKAHKDLYIYIGNILRGACIPIWRWSTIPLERSGSWTGHAWLLIKHRLEYLKIGSCCTISWFDSTGAVLFHFEFYIYFILNFIL